MTLEEIVDLQQQSLSLSFDAYPSPEPFPDLKLLFEEQGDFFRAELRLGTHQLTPQLTMLENTILSKLALFPAYSHTDLSRELEISSDTVREYIARLKSKGLLVREGGRRYGSWKVTDVGLQLIKNQCLL